jgi:hypothetical protein
MSDSVPRDLTPEEAAGMTVNERLWVSGLMSKWDQAIAEQDETKLRLVCQQVYLENIDFYVNEYINK